MANLANVVQQLRIERDRAATEVQRLDAAIAALNGAGRSRRTNRRRLSAAARARIAAAQRARWAKVRAGGSKGKVVRMPKRRTLSTASRRKIAAAQKKRWATQKANQKKPATKVTA